MGWAVWALTPAGTLLERTSWGGHATTKCFLVKQERSQDVWTPRFCVSLVLSPQHHMDGVRDARCWAFESLNLNALHLTNLIVVLVVQSCPIFFDRMDCSLPGS